jgi:hypothetical protein
MRHPKLRCHASRCSLRPHILPSATPCLRTRRAGAGRRFPSVLGCRWSTARRRPRSAGLHEFCVCRATAMMSLSTPCPASCRPAPGPVIVISPTGLARKMRALVAPSILASGSPAGTASGCTRAVTVPVPSGPENASAATCRSRPPRRGCLAGLLAGDTSDALAGDLFAAELPAEHERGQDHHLGDRVMALYVGGRV